MRSIRQKAIRLLQWILKLLGDEPPIAAPQQEPESTEGDVFTNKGMFYNAPSYQSSELPASAQTVLRLDNPRLLELKKRYASFQCPVNDHVSWTSEYIRNEVDLENFRGDNAYVWQMRGLSNLEMAQLKYLLTAYYTQKIDRLGLFDKLTEDVFFGAYTFDVNGITVSRDLLDSVNEISFLERHLSLSTKQNARIVDIGAGYGRLAHRMVSSLPNVERIFCADAVAESTFLCEFYLQFRGVDDKATAVPLYEIEEALAREPVEIAVNVHSFSECTAAAVEWWLQLLDRHQVKYLMVVPNDGAQLLSREKDGSHRDLAPLMERYGYRLMIMEPEYLDESVQKYGVHGSYYHLFQRR